ncbi:threo-3-hydroxy-L-aspartate ammonia-lyase [Candidatus Sumerlaeota bacterium]|nr:threo-3-hydroxy-L-aspartate ammonia-lyase [Candidatus Sumerlaeota bacterium]
MSELLAVGFDDVVAAGRRLADAPVIHTPVLHSQRLDAIGGANLFFKCENLQHVGAFKFRGAFNAMSRLTDEQKQRGVLTFSSGNHGQAIACCGKALGIATVVIMPATAPRLKIDNTREFGAEVILYDPEREAREQIAARLEGERGMTLIPPFDHPHVIAGQGTVAMELLRSHGPLDVLYVPVGGGGLISGCAIAAHALAPQCRVIGVEPEGADDAARSLRSGTLQVSDHPTTIADGARTKCLGNLTFPIIRQRVKEIVTVNDDQLMDAMRLVLQHLKIVIEPTGALAVAAALARAAHDGGNRRVGVVISGGNVDPAFLAKVIA